MFSGSPTSHFNSPSEAHSPQVRHTAIPPPAALCEASSEATCSSSMVLVHFITLLLECQTFLCVVCILYARQYICRDKSCNFKITPAVPPGLIRSICIHSCILTYAFFDNGVCSPARLLILSVRPQKPIHSKSGLPRSHRLRLSVKRPLKLLALPQRFSTL